jgi:DNA recombination protein RmuC
MNQHSFEIAGRLFSLSEILAGIGGLAAAVLLVLLLVAWRRAVARAEHGRETESRLAELVRAQSEMSGRMQTMAEVFGSRQSDLVRGLSERLDGLGHRIGQSMTDTTRATHENLSKLHERLAVIDNAQKNITALSSQVVELQHILANKQTRGAFGQARMEAIIQDGLPSGAYQFQATLKNGTRPDCLIVLPNGTPGLVIDAKFPLEAWNNIRGAASPEAAKAAEAQFRRDTQKHIDDIAARYFVPGETQDTAFMFVPSESIFADIHEHFEDIVQRAHRARVVIVSPSLLMLSVQVVMSLLRDAQMREQAHVIQDEVTKLLVDVERLDDRVRKLQAHFSQATTDIDNILTSTRKITGRAQKIDAMDFSESEAKTKPAPPRRDEAEVPELPFRRIAD